MSRTEKDTPWWVKAEEWAAIHYQCDRRYDSPETLTYWNGARGGRKCDLSPEPSILRWKSEGINGSRAGRWFCHWEPVWPERWKGRRIFQKQPPRWFRRDVWKAPDRNEARDAIARYLKEYRATGESDIIPPTNSHRHCARWLW